MLVIHDEQLAKELQEIADRENRPVEDVLKTMVNRYPTEATESTVESAESEAIRRVRHKAYDKARTYWESVGDTAKAAMTDEELDREFGAFDEEGIPRLKSELDSLEPPVGSLAYAAKIAETSQFASGKPDLAQRMKEILDEHLADDLMRGVKVEDADRSHSR
jgi:hypothetical protein